MEPQKNGIEERTVENECRASDNDDDVQPEVPKTPEQRACSSDKKKATLKREDYLEWPDYFMAIAFLSAQRSKDPSTQVGACIVSPEKKIVGIGYNGMPIGCSDDEMPWGREGETILDTKHAFGKALSPNHFLFNGIRQFG